MLRWYEEIMSLKEKTSFRCGHCGKNFEAEIWSSVNSEINPEMRDSVRSLDVFKVKCPHCGDTELVERPFVYNEMQKGFMIQLIPNGSEAEVKQMLNFFSGKGGEGSDVLATLLRRTSDLQIRLVTTIPRFKEKIAILDEQMDDRLVEIAKVLCKTIASKGEDVDAYFFRNPEIDKLCIGFYNPKNQDSFYMEINQQVYDLVKQNYSTDIKKLSEPTIVVDEKWARQFIAEHPKE